MTKQIMYGRGIARRPWASKGAPQLGKASQLSSCAAPTRDPFEPSRNHPIRITIPTILLTKYTFHAIIHNDRAPTLSNRFSRLSYSRPFNNFHTPIFGSLQPPYSQHFTHSSQNMVGYTPKSEPKAKPIALDRRSVIFHRGLGARGGRVRRGGFWRARFRWRSRRWGEIRRSLSS